MRDVRTLNTLPERYPYSCQWEITCRCNLRCVMCYTDCCNRPDAIRHELTTPEILRIMDELAEAGCLELCLTGGEPLARPDFFTLYDHAVASGFLVTLFTNGTLVTEDVADRLAALPPHRIEISLHGLTEATFEQVTQGRGSHGKCLTAIQLLRERGLPLLLKTTAMTVNQHEIMDIKRYAQDLGVGYALGEDLRPALDGGEGPFRYALSPVERDELNRGDPDLWQEACRQQAAPPTPCRSGMRTFHIDAYGGLQLCSGNRAQSYDLRQGSFKEGFYRHLPTFACPWKAQPSAHLLQPTASHA
ncbi:MAG TPA: radical SAM protein [Nitrospiraceae bacterium]|jgi:MoaA/NifB/PqqE/SkfB family radical SAM enzyme|nr:radical SAM protein [Nitrospiraceae bacterium]